MTNIPMNDAASLIVSAQSLMGDLTTQISELTTAMNKQQALIDSLVAVAQWGEAPSEEESEVTEVDDPETED